MTALDFVAWVQLYYAPYPEGQKRDIWEYLKELAPTYLDGLKAALTKGYSSQYGKAPDCAIFESMVGATLKEQDAMRQPIPASNRIESQQEDYHRKRLDADFDELGITSSDPQWITKVWQLRIKRGDYKQGSGGRVTLQERNGVKVMDVRPFRAGSDFGERKPKVIAWDELGGSR